jgi:hypothetical protein
MTETHYNGIKNLVWNFDLFYDLGYPVIVES